MTLIEILAERKRKAVEEHEKAQGLRRDEPMVLTPLPRPDSLYSADSEEWELYFQSCGF